VGTSIVPPGPCPPRPDTPGTSPAVTAPQVTASTHDFAVPLAEGLPDARLVTLEGRYHLPDIRDLDRIVDTITAFLSRPL